MAKQEYLIETVGRDGRWYILGSHKTNGEAQSQMHRTQRLFPKDPFRVVEHPSRILMLMSDPRPEILPA